MDVLDELKNQVFGRQKFLAEIYSRCGDLSLYDYVSGWPNPAKNAAAEPFILLAQKMAGEIYGDTVAEAIAGQLRQNPTVSTIDHHGILNHPFFINSNLIFSLRSKAKYLICLSTEGVSLNNSSWPGCLLVSEADGALRRFSFFADKHKTKAVLAAQALQKADVGRLLKHILGSNFLGPEQKFNLQTLAEGMFASPDVYDQPNFSAQASVLSGRLWSKIFPSAPELVYLPLESLVSRVLTNIVIPEQGHLLHRLLFTPQGWDLLEKYFLGSLGAFSGLHKGSFLYWAVNSSGRRMHLKRAGDKAQGQGVSVGLKAGAIAKALGQKQVYPTSLVCFLVLLYFGIDCAGGFNQVNWLSDIKEKFIGLLTEMQEPASAKKIALANTENFAEGNLAFLPSRKGLFKAGGVDLYFTGRDYYKNYERLSRNLTVAQSIETLLPEIYRVVVPAEQRDTKLLALSDSEIAESDGLWAKIRSFLA